MILNKFEKEDLIIKLLNEGRTIRDIAKEAHISFRQIGEISRKFKGETQAEPTNPKSIQTQALTLFKEGKSQIDVATQLDISSKKVTAVYKEFLRLNGMQELVSLFERIKLGLPKFLKLFYALNDSNLSVDDFVTAINHIYQLPIIEQRRDKLLSEIDILTNKKSILTNNLEYLSRVAKSTNSKLKNDNALYCTGSSY